MTRTISDHLFEKKIARDTFRSGSKDGRRPCCTRACDVKPPFFKGFRSDSCPAHPLRVVKFPERSDSQCAEGSVVQRYKGTLASNMNDFHAKGATTLKPFRFAIIPFFKESTFSR
ncbi:hypothetical protein L6218_04345 [Pseudomonas syringae pv. syringae]|uniref:hypothetical protein n=1 Tax=Pseudomonas TaxID=286 RepID=UPI001010A68C|nr:hypothetical protein [Pseudomonas syringae]MCF5180110.1 hypothetical protein [Pseudomonas syringae]MCF5313280.1 hypothetical protein [Pseudomonas syringae]MCF5361448.1 hypothetical protein [Pseudomonas syringae]MCF5388253.1 hypothetical protein [Pseudomonas syringae]MCF5396534.1 hypothetical protein [Pseudomonas syringae]